MSEQEQPLEVREAALNEQLKAEMEQNPQAVHSRLGNLWMNVIPAEGEEISFRGAPVLLGRLDMKPADYLKPEELSQHSELRKKQTYKEFFAVLDSSREKFDRHHEIELGVKNLKLLQTSSPSELGQMVEKLNEKLIPVYAHLKAMGYEDADFNK